jgi:hypothetical protein
MKTLLQIIAICYMATGALFSQTNTVDEQLNKLWRNKDYPAIKSLLEVNRLTRSPDPALLYCAGVFFVFVDPDKPKALASLSKLKDIAESTGKRTFIELATNALNDVQRMPESVFAPREASDSEKILRAMHHEFDSVFPDTGLAAQLRASVKPH